MSAMYFAAAALLIASPFVQAGQVSIVNNCDYEVFVTPSQGGADKPIECYQPGATFTAPITGEAQDLKIMTYSGFCMSNDCVQLEYSVAGTDLFYDLSNINAKGMGKFVESGMSVSNSDPNAPQVSCPPGKGQCSKGVYNEWWQNENTFCSKGDADIKMDLCLSNMGGSSSSSHSSQPQQAAPVVQQSSSSSSSSSSTSTPAPQQTTLATQVASSYSAPSTTTAANVHAVHPIGETSDGKLDINNGDSNVQWVTDYVTATTIVYANAKRAEATAAVPIERRHIHRHAHAHQHNA